MDSFLKTSPRCFRGLPYNKVKRNEVGKVLRDRILNDFTKERMISAMAKEYIAVMNNAGSQ
jgi:hypothetical protein